MSVKEHQLQLDLKCKDAVIHRMRTEIAHMKGNGSQFNPNMSSYQSQYIPTEPVPISFCGDLCQCRNHRQILDEIKECLARKC